MGITPLHAGASPSGDDTHSQTMHSDLPISATDGPLFQKDKHTAYWLRCLRSPLPHHYTSMDANRTTLAFFTLSALDLLGELFTKTTEAERAAQIAWLYSLQHPRGGFRAFPGTDFLSRSNTSNARWDPANLPATYFALASLAVLGDDLTRVQHAETLSWLRTLQRADGSFGEWLSTSSSAPPQIQGGTDARYAYCAAAVRWFLRGPTRTGAVHAVPDIDLAALAHSIQASQSYDGGLASEPLGESHAGFTYCGVGALALTGQLQGASTTFRARAARWLAARATPDVEDDADAEAHSASTTTTTSGVTPSSSFGSAGSAAHPEPRWMGFAGRPNKLADTCYAWWAAGALAMLGVPLASDHEALRRYLLAKVQHLIVGGFGKMPGDPPDVYHSYLGLAVLAVVGTGRGGGVLGVKVEDQRRDRLAEAVRLRLDHEQGLLREVDPALCMSVRARDWVEKLPWRRAIVEDQR